jgi:mono/diheme cytochrome c family protein
MRRALFLLFSAACVIAAASRSVWDGVYTKEQAGRGKDAYTQECMKCHAENLLGGEDAPALAGADFLRRWNTKPVGALFESIRKTMPSDDPGSLSTRQCADIVAYVLSMNEFPAGQKELENEAGPLNEIRIEGKR